MRGKCDSLVYSYADSTIRLYNDPILWSDENQLTADSIWIQLKSLINEDHNYKTLVIDSVTALERLFIQDVVDSDPKKPKSIRENINIQARTGFLIDIDDKLIYFFLI